MAKTVTATAVKRIITKGLTGWEAGKLVLQDLIDTFFGKDSVLSESDMAAIQQAPMESADIRDYNLFMGLYRGFHRGYMLAEWACKDAEAIQKMLETGVESKQTDARLTLERVSHRNGGKE